MKVYYEIKFNVAKTTYFPNFDNFGNDQEKAQIAILALGVTNQKLDALSQLELDLLFQKCIGREVAHLEMDMMEASS